jgi:TolB-like protein
MCHALQHFFLALWIIPTFFLPLAAQIQVAIGEFNNQSDAFYLDQWERTLPDLLQTKLSSSPTVAVLERRKLKAVLEEKALALTGLMDSTNAQTIGNLLEAEYIIFGTIHHIDNQYRIDASIVKVSSGQIQSEKVVSPDQKHLSEMVELLGNNILFNFTGTGKYRNRIKLTRYPTKYFLAATVGLGAATLVAQSQYNKYLDDYRNNSELEKFNTLYDKANRTKKISVGLASLTGTALLGTIYCWVKNLSPAEIYAQNPGTKTTHPYLAINWKNEVKIGVQIHF